MTGWRIMPMTSPNILGRPPLWQGAWNSMNTSIKFQVVSASGAAFPTNYITYAGWLRLFITFYPPWVHLEAPKLRMLPVSIPGFWHVIDVIPCFLPESMSWNRRSCAVAAGLVVLVVPGSAWRKRLRGRLIFVSWRHTVSGMPKTGFFDVSCISSISITLQGNHSSTSSCDGLNSKWSLHVWALAVKSPWRWPGILLA